MVLTSGLGDALVPPSGDARCVILDVDVYVCVYIYIYMCIYIYTHYMI